MMHQALHPSDDVDRQNVSKKGGIGFSNWEGTVDASIQQL